MYIHIFTYIYTYIRIPCVMNMAAMAPICIHIRIQCSRTRWIMNMAAMSPKYIYIYIYIYMYTCKNTLNNEHGSHATCIYIYIYIHKNTINNEHVIHVTSVCNYIYIYILEYTEQWTWQSCHLFHLSLSKYIYIYIYIY